MNLAVLPLAITMLAGPQIMSALIFITTERPIAASLAFVAGVAVAVTAGVAITTWLAGRVAIGPASGPIAKIVEAALVVWLIAMAIRNWVNRETVEPPKWLGRMMSAGPDKAFVAGLLLIGLFPSDVVVMLTVGVDLTRNGAPLTAALPFILATVLIAALPLLSYLLFRHRAAATMPAVRDWMTDHSWLITIIACLFFAVLLLL